MFDQGSDRPAATLVAGLILLILLAAIAAISGEPAAPTSDEIVGAGVAFGAEMGNGIQFSILNSQF